MMEQEKDWGEECRENKRRKISKQRRERRRTVRKEEKINVLKREG